MNIKSKTVTKSIFKIFGISFLGFYFPDLVFIIFAFVFKAEGTDLIDFPGVDTLIALSSIIYAFFTVIILYVSSLMDRRALNKWFVFGFSLYSFLGIFIIKDLFYSVGFILISLVFVFVAMNIKRWIKRPGDEKERKNG